MADQDQADIRLEFARLKQEHADLDAAINAMIATNCDALQIQRLNVAIIMGSQSDWETMRHAAETLDALKRRL
jgi:hypothetical protein